MQNNLVYAFVVVLILLAVQTASALKCYSCSGLVDCRAPFIENCSESAANKTSSTLKAAYNITDMRGTDFECLQLKLTRPNNSSAVESEVRGCVYRKLDVCSQPLKPSLNYGKICTVCRSDLCNRNLAPNMISNVSTLLAPIFSVLALKRFAFG